jgi:SecD/SecF fusion protein
MGGSKYFFAMSGVILILGALAIGAKGLNLGIDFTSGTRIVAELKDQTSEEGVRDALAPLGLGKAKIQKVSGDEFESGSAYQISTDTLSGAERERVETTLEDDFGGGTFSFETIGPTFGNTVAEGAIIAIIASLIVISSYIALRFEWKYAVPVLIATMHDVLITAGVYALFGFEVTTATVAALLTILGYSLYDTIIVFDRIRENVPRMPRATYSQIMNRSLSEVLMRSLATSLCTLLPVLALLFFGGETLQDFAFALAVGVLSGTYSSIFIASPTLMHWKESEPVFRKRRARVKAANGGVVPAYATAAGGAAMEVEVAAPKRASKRLTSPEDPERQVGREEFQEMVDNLGIEEQPKPSATATADPDPPDPGADLTPEDLVMKDQAPKAPKQRRPRNRRHGR